MFGAVVLKMMQKFVFGIVEIQNQEVVPEPQLSFFTRMFRIS